MAGVSHFLDRSLVLARQALADLDADQVPADLIRVFRHSGGLTPPLKTSLLRGIERYEWLRSSALERWPEGERDRPGPQAAALALLEGDAGWRAILEEAEQAFATSVAAAALETALARVAELEEREAVTRARMAERSKTHERDIRSLRSERDDARSQLREARSSDQRDDASRLAEIAEARQGAATLRVAVDHATERSRALADEAHHERSRRRRAEAALAEERAEHAWADDAGSIAARLDEVVTLARPPVAIRSGGYTPQASDWRLPPGVAPDGAAAIEHLLRQSVPTTVLVDGYNVGFAITPGADPAEARRRLAPELDRLSLLAAAPMKVIVVYDGEDDVRQAGAGSAAEVRFTSGEADDVLIALAHEMEGTVVVVSSDAEVRAGVEAAGAIPLWSKALLEWVTRR